jgi:hypothetical protein
MDDLNAASERKPPYIYFLNRMGRKGQRCDVLARGTMNSCLVRFEDGFTAVISRYAIRRGQNASEAVDVDEPRHASRRAAMGPFSL